MIAAVTKDAGDAAAKRLFNPDKATIAVAGPWTGPADHLPSSTIAIPDASPA